MSSPWFVRLYEEIIPLLACGLSPVQVARGLSPVQMARGLSPIQMDKPWYNYLCHPHYFDLTQYEIFLAEVPFLARMVYLYV